MQHSARLLLLTSALTAGAAGSLANYTSSSESPADAGVDAAPLPRVQRVNCPRAVAGEFTEITVDPTGPSYAYSPMSMKIKAGDIVRFRSGAIHTTLSIPRGLFEIETGQTECFKFNSKETHNFVCGVHGFAAKLIVE